jgi:hypothetical protein
LYWAEPEKLVVSTLDAQTNLLHWEINAWTIKPGLDTPARPQPAIIAFLTPQGITLENYAVVPGTAGALAFAWGPRTPETVAGMALPYPLYFLSDDPAGIAQVWQWPLNNAPVHPLTAESAPVLAYAIAPDQAQLAYRVNRTLIAAALDGTAGASWDSSRPARATPHLSPGAATDRRLPITIRAGCGPCPPMAVNRRVSSPRAPGPPTARWIRGCICRRSGVPMGPGC